MAVASRAHGGGSGIGYPDMPARAVALFHLTGITAGKFQEHELWSFQDAPYVWNSMHLQNIEVGTEVMLRITAIRNGYHFVELLGSEPPTT